MILLHPFLMGNSEMKELTRSFNWTATPLGPMEEWRESLQVSLGMVMQSRFPQMLLVGQELICFYNDAFKAALGEKGLQPGILGKPLAEAWPDCWQIVQPLAAKVWAGGEATWTEDQRIPRTGSGVNEDFVWSFSCSAVPGENGAPGAVLFTLDQSTQKLVDIGHTKGTNSERLFRNLVMQSPIAMAIVRGPEHIVEMANTAMLEGIWLRTTGQVIGRKMLEIFPELKKQKYASLLHKVYTEKIRHAEKEAPAYLEGEDGIRKGWFDFEFHPIAAEEEGDAGILVTLNDVTETVENRRRIEASEERLRLAVQATKLGTWEYYPLTDQLTCSGECRTVFNLTSDCDINFALFKNQIVPEDIQKATTAIRVALNPSGSGEYNLELRILGLTADSFRWVRIKGKVYFNSQQQAERFIGTIVDITEEKQFQQAVEDSEQRSRLAIEAAGMGTFDWDFASNRFISSQKLKDIFGFQNRSDISHADLIKAIHPEDRTRRDQEVVESPEKRSLSYDARVIWPDATVRWVRVLGKMIYDDQDKPVKMYGTVVDISNEKGTMLALQENTARLNLAIETAGLGMWEVNLKDGSTFYSKRCLQLLGFGDDSMPQRADVLARIHTDDMMDQKQVLRDALATGAFDSELRILPDGITIKWMKARGRILYDEYNVPEKMLGILMDVTETKNTLSILRESEERFRNAANNAPVLIWMADPGMNCHFLNTEWLNFTGTSMDDQLGNGWLKVIHPDEQASCFALNEAAMQKREPIHMEYRLRRFDGVYRWISDKAVPRFTSDGRFEGYIGACTEIHDEKISGERLQKSELLFKTISNVAPVALWMTDTLAMCTFVNDTWIQWTGDSFDAHLGAGWLNRVVAEDRQTAYQRFWDCMQAKDKYEAEFRLLRADGNIQWCLTEGSPYFDIAGNFAGYAGFVSDITERKQVQEELENMVLQRTQELKRSEERHFKMVNEVQDYAILLLSREGIIENWNKGSEKIKGYTAAEAVGKHFRMFYTEEANAQKMPETLIKNATETGRASQEGWRVKKDGTRFWASVVITALHDNENNVIGFSKVTRDLTERKLAEDKLEASNRELEKVNNALEKSNAELEQFAYVASHDLQEPLRKIKFFAGKLETMMEPALANGKEYFQKIQKSSDRMNTLIRDLLDFSKISNGQEVFVPTDLNDILTNICDDFELLIQQKDAKVVIQNLPVIEAVPLQMQQLFYNLMSNALKFSKENEPPNVEVSAALLSDEEARQHELAPERKYYVISIKDNGIGFDQEYADQVFVIFQRLNDLFTYGGTGIGLALCKKIALNHGGKIYATAEEDKGATFNIVLPANHHSSNES